MFSRTRLDRAALAGGIAPLEDHDQTLAGCLAGRPASRTSCDLQRLHLRRRSPCSSSLRGRGKSAVRMSSLPAFSMALRTSFGRAFAEVAADRAVEGQVHAGSPPSVAAPVWRSGPVSAIRRGRRRGRWPRPLRPGRHGAACGRRPGAGSAWHRAAACDSGIAVDVGGHDRVGGAVDDLDRQGRGSGSSRHMRTTSGRRPFTWRALASTASRGAGSGPPRHDPHIRAAPGRGRRSRRWRLRPARSGAKAVTSGTTVARPRRDAGQAVPAAQPARPGHRRAAEDDQRRRLARRPQRPGHRDRAAIAVADDDRVAHAQPVGRRPQDVGLHERADAIVARAVATSPGRGGRRPSRGSGRSSLSTQIEGEVAQVAAGAVDQDQVGTLARDLGMNRSVRPPSTNWPVGGIRRFGRRLARRGAPVHGSGAAAEDDGGEDEASGQSPRYHRAWTDRSR